MLIFHQDRSEIFRSVLVVEIKNQSKSVIVKAKHMSSCASINLELYSFINYVRRAERMRFMHICI